eukprot:IDg20153t1
MSTPCFSAPALATAGLRRRFRVSRCTQRAHASASAPASAPVPPAAAPISVSLRSLGCPKNVTDAEVMLGDLEKQGMRIVSNEADSDVVLVNTCGFVQDAKRESIAAIVDA